MAIRNNQEAFTLDEVRFVSHQHLSLTINQILAYNARILTRLLIVKHIRTLEGYISSDFEGKTAHNMSQYVRGHLMIFIDSLMGVTQKSADLETEEWQANG